MPSVNEELRDRTIRHLVHLNRLSNQESRWLTEKYDSYLWRIIQRYEASDPRLLRTKKLAELERSINEILVEFRGESNTAFSNRLREIASNETEWQERLLNRTVPVELDTSMPSPEQLRNIIRDEAVQGKYLTDHFTDINENTRRRVMSEIRQGVMEGDSTEEITRRLRGTKARGYRDGALERSRRDADNIARTMTQYVANRAREDHMLANEDIIKGRQVVATLDSRTCPMCMGLDGKVLQLRKGRRPPFHHRCRCATIPVTKSWRELGIDLDEAPEGTRASMDGQVAASQTFNDWLKRQPAPVQDEALGPTRGKAYRKGNLSVSEFTDGRGNTITIEEMRQLEPDLFD